LTTRKPAHERKKPGRKPMAMEDRKVWTLPMIREHCFVTVTGCWEYRQRRRFNLGPRTKTGERYFALMHKGKPVQVHKLAWMLLTGREVPEGRYICPVKCNNPKCCNPFHTGPVTQSEKQKLASARGAFDTPHRALACALGKQNSPKAKLDPDKVRRIRAMTDISAKAGAAQFGISANVFNKVRNRLSWKNITD
jgi:hypothetical protein